MSVCFGLALDLNLHNVWQTQQWLNIFKAVHAFGCPVEWVWSMWLRFADAAPIGKWHAQNAVACACKVGRSLMVVPPYMAGKWSCETGYNLCASHWAFVSS